MSESAPSSRPAGRTGRAPARLGLTDPDAGTRLADLGWWDGDAPVEGTELAVWALARSPDPDLALLALERLRESLDEGEWAALAEALRVDQGLRGRLFGVLGGLDGPRRPPRRPPRALAQPAEREHARAHLRPLGAAGPRRAHAHAADRGGRRARRRRAPRHGARARRDRGAAPGLPRRGARPRRRRPAVGVRARAAGGAGRGRRGPARRPRLRGPAGGAGRRGRHGRRRPRHARTTGSPATRCRAVSGSSGWASAAAAS